MVMTMIMIIFPKYYTNIFFSVSEKRKCWSFNAFFNFRKSQKSDSEVLVFYGGVCNKYKSANEICRPDHCSSITLFLSLQNTCRQYSIDNFINWTLFVFLGFAIIFSEKICSFSFKFSQLTQIQVFRCLWTVCDEHIIILVLFHCLLAEQ